MQELTKRQQYFGENIYLNNDKINIIKKDCFCS